MFLLPFVGGRKPARPIRSARDLGGIRRTIPGEHRSTRKAILLDACSGSIGGKGNHAAEG